MKPVHFNFLFFGLIMLLSSCEVIGDIFKAGVWVGVIIVVVVIALIIWLIRKIL
ncbi:phosphatidate cytidylyltransferase [Rubrolithibacter danxiaensis]|uniref:phosphatidate cytidylyltransferase n=1 Tax=Rubrolithibacter danxiaensis TaxID=3390805 RepID=UPI003BF7DBD6